MKSKVAAIDEQERLRRMRMQNMGMHVSLDREGRGGDIEYGVNKD